MMGKHLFVTVGTTKFDELINSIIDPKILDLLEELGYNSIQLQTGTTSTEKIDKASHKHKIDIKFNTFFENFKEQIDKSDLVISHAGAGSCLEVLKSGKPLIVVVNENLMDNHQIELAKHLGEKKHLYYCTCNTLERTLKENLNLLKPYQAADGSNFIKYLDNCVGFT